MPRAISDDQFFLSEQAASGVLQRLLFLQLGYPVKGVKELILSA